MAQHDAAQRQSLGARGADEVRVHHLNHRAAGNTRDTGDIGQRQRHHRQHHIAQLPTVPAAAWQPFQGDGEKQHQQRRHHEAGYHHAGHGDPHHRIIPQAVLPERRDDARRHAEDHRQHEGRQAQPGRDRERMADQIVNRIVFIFKRRAEVAVRQLDQVIQILFADGIVQVVLRFDVRHHFRRQRALAGKRTAGREAHHKE